MNLFVQVPSIMEIRVSRTFELEKAVCNHGFFMMAPNRWDPSTKSLVRPLRLPPDNRHSVTVSISQPRPTFISISLIDDHDQPPISPSHHQHIVNQVKRMLRLSKQQEEAIKAFHLLHADAASKGFGRVFRNPTLFEDIVKTFLLCASRFKESLERAEKLCGMNSKRKRGKRGQVELNFPTPEEVLNFGWDKLKAILGIRAKWVFNLATQVTNGKIDLNRWENSNLNLNSNGDELYKELGKIDGIADFAASNILMCIGFYHRVPVDSETKRHTKQVHLCENNKITQEMIMNVYNKYAPFQTLAYWFELLQYYESKVGKLSLLEKADYKKVTGSLIEKQVNNATVRL